MKNLTLASSIFRICICSDHEFSFMDNILDLMFGIIKHVADEYILEVSDAESLKNEAIYIISKLIPKINGSLRRIN